MVNILHSGVHCSPCACESDDSGDVQLGDTDRYARCIDKYPQKVIDVSNKDGIRTLHFILLPFF